MKKQMRRISASLLSLMLVAAMLVSGLAVLAADEAGSVSLRVEGASSNLLYQKGISVEGEVSVYEILVAALDVHKLDYVEQDGYISQIGDEAAGAFGGWDGWNYYVDGQSPPVAMGEYMLKGGEDILVCYADPFGEEPTLLPQVSVKEVSGEFAALFTFTAQVTTYDEAGNASTQTVPITEATATIEGKAYTTDSQGRVSVSRHELTGQAASVQLEKSTAAGKPLVVRFADDYTVALGFNSLSFNDVSANAWYREYVLELVALGAINGYGDGTFRPTREVTRAEFIKILACTVEDFNAASVAYQPYFGDVLATDWFAPYIVWAVDNGILDKGGDFSPNLNLTRQDMALMAYRFSQNVLKQTLPNDQPAPAFNDDAQIAGHCKEAVYHLQKAGIINGLPGNVFSPSGNTLRSEVSKVIILLLSAGK